MHRAIFGVSLACAHDHQQMSTIRDKLRAAYAAIGPKQKRDAGGDDDDDAPREDEFDADVTDEQLAAFVATAPRSRNGLGVFAVAVYYDLHRRALGTLDVLDVDVAWPDQLDAAYAAYESAAGHRVLLHDMRAEYRAHRKWTSAASSNVQ